MATFAASGMENFLLLVYLFIYLFILHFQISTMNFPERILQTHSLSESINTQHCLLALFFFVICLFVLGQNHSDFSHTDSEIVIHYL